MRIYVQTYVFHIRNVYKVREDRACFLVSPVGKWMAVYTAPLMRPNLRHIRLLHAP